MNVKFYYTNWKIRNSEMSIFPNIKFTSRFRTISLHWLGCCLYFNFKRSRISRKERKAAKEYTRMLNAFRTTEYVHTPWRSNYYYKWSNGKIDK